MFLYVQFRCCLPSCHFLLLFWSLASSLCSSQVSRLCDCVLHPNVFHLRLIVFPPSCLFKLRPPFCLFQMVCRFHQHSSLLCFPEWFPVYLFYTWASWVVRAGPLYLCCASWLPGFDFCFIKWLCISMTVWFLLCVLRPVLDGNECLQNLILLEEVDSWDFKCQLLSEE